MLWKQHRGGRIRFVTLVLADLWRIHPVRRWLVLGMRAPGLRYGGLVIGLAMPQLLQEPLKDPLSSSESFYQVIHDSYTLGSSRTVWRIMDG